MNRASVAALLLLLVAGTLGLRLAGLGWGLPCLKEPDTFIAEHVRSIRKGAPRELDREFSACQYPSLLAQLCAALPEDAPAPADGSWTLAQHLRAASQPWLDVRLVVALLSALAIPATYLVARRFVAPGWALCAAALVAFSLLHTFFAQQARPHAVMVSFTALGLASALWLRRSPGWPAYLATTLVAALAVGTLHNGFFVLPAIAAAQFLREDRRRWDGRILIAVAAVALSFRAFYWFYFDDAVQAALAEEGASHVVWSDLPVDFSGFARLARTLWFYEPVLLALAAAAAVAWLARVRRVSADALVVLAHAAPYALAFGAFSHTYERFTLPLLPALAVFAAWGLAAFHARLAAGRAWFVAGCCAALALPGFVSAKLAWLRAQPSTLEQTAQWLRDNALPTGAPLYAMPPMDFPLMRTKDALRGNRYTPWSEYQWRLGEEQRVAPLAALRWFSPRKREVRLETDELAEAYLRSYGAGLAVTDGVPLDPERMAVRTALARHHASLARFSPDSDPRASEHMLYAQDDASDDWPHVFWRVLRARAIGPVIEVYRLE